MKKWYEEAGPHGEIVVSTRVRLARNYEAYPFPCRMSGEMRRTLLDAAAKTMTESASGTQFSCTELTAADPLTARALVERHLISPELAQNEEIRGVILSGDERVSVMVGEEDHLRIQVLGPGLCLEDCLKEAMRADDLLESVGPYAFDERLGYLTHCPTNLGTGMRASVMLHMPALSETGTIRDIIAAAGKVGFAVRGLYGEGSRAAGAMYQLSNQATLGLSEEEIVRRLEEATENILSRERELRERLSKEDAGFFDRIWRAVGLLAAARRIPSQECAELLSQLRLGVAMGEIKGVTVDDINRLTRETSPATLSLAGGGALTGPQRDAARAALTREVAKKALCFDANHGGDAMRS